MPWAPTCPRKSRECGADVDPTSSISLRSRPGVHSLGLSLVQVPYNQPQAQLKEVNTYYSTLLRFNKVVGQKKERKERKGINERKGRKEGSKKEKRKENLPHGSAVRIK